MALNNGWIRIDTVSGSGSTAVSAVVLEQNTGRTVMRSQTLVGTTAHGDTATCTIKQDPKGAFITIDRVETTNGSEIAMIPAGGGDFLLVGYANVDYIEATETSGKSYTDLNDDQGRLWEYGFTIIDGLVSYTGVMPESTIHTQTQFVGVTPQIGTTRQYTFKIPFYAYENDSSSDRVVELNVADDSSIAATFSIRQIGTSS